ncbi:MAG: 4-hydroxythreonine-4-phosphate dehydrogenase PdxA [Actinomycetia bacterium]|nr:4-hydroxythreonine-4-phosphate dehydrogenase PdxA [Actinomycetes bacterium]
MTGGSNGRPAAAVHLGITMGDPLGIGPEVVVKALAAWAADPDRPAVRWVVFGDAPRLEAVRARLAPALAWGVAEDEAAWADRPEPVVVVPGPAVDEPWGRISAAAGRAAYAYIQAAVAAALAGRLAGVVTAPIHKEAIHLAGVSEPGHTEILQQLTGARAVAMMLVGGGLRVAHVSTHVSLADALARVTPERIRAVTRMTLDALPRFGVTAPRVAVAGLNPHNGEHGLFGDTEDRVIRPAVEAMRAEGWPVVGPVPADTVFVRARAGEFDAVVAQYHDQGHIPVKLLAFDEAVNLTLGLPIIRTSVDHGTGFDIAGTGVARAESMLAAMRVAARLAGAPEPGRMEAGRPGGAV